jgi:DNA-binding CsgD family transcriptional regulator
MKIAKKNNRNFAKKFADTFKKNGIKRKDIDFFNKLPLYRKECFVIIDILQKQIIYKKGFKNIFGYDDNEVTIDLIKSNIHPDDAELVFRIGKATIKYCMDNKSDCSDFLYLVSYRQRKKNGSYIKILSRITAFEINENGLMKSLFIKFTDISFMDKTNTINWDFDVANLDKEIFRQNIYKAYQDFFTGREIEIINEIESGFTNKLIAKKLNISEHTVATHRKSIFKKSNCHNTIDLLSFCKRKGII